MELTFRPAVVSQCINVSIVDDSLLESTEEFSMELSTTDLDVMLVNSLASVIIVDDDGKYNSSKPLCSHEMMFKYKHVSFITQV